MINPFSFFEVFNTTLPDPKKHKRYYKFGTIRQLIDEIKGLRKIIKPLLIIVPIALFTFITLANIFEDTAILIFGS